MLFSLFYILLKIQTDIAATNFLNKHPDVAPENSPAEDYFAQIKIPTHLTNNLPHNEPAKVLPIKPHLSQTKKQENKKPFQLPKFNGKAYEVLGVEENAITQVIQKAFRHWIKHYHPDHQQTQVNRKATVQARKLQEAKQEMLDARAKSRMAKAA